MLLLICIRNATVLRIALLGVILLFVLVSAVRLRQASRVGEWAAGVRGVVGGLLPSTLGNELGLRAGARGALIRELTGSSELSDRAGSPLRIDHARLWLHRCEGTRCSWAGGVLRLPRRRDSEGFLAGGATLRCAWNRMRLVMDGAVAKGYLLCDMSVIGIGTQ